jgi:putative ABC transport system permease protein
VGRTVLLLTYDDASRSSKDVPYQVVGVVRSARLADPREEADPAMYLPMLQAGPLVARIVVRTAGDPEGLAGPIRAIVRRHDRNVLMSDVQTMDAVVDRAFADFRMMVRYLGLFAAVALFLAAVGLYGALAYDVSQRAHEIGVRAAMGATRAGILALVLRRGTWLVGIGMVAGVAAACPGTRLVRHLLFDTVPLDPAVYAGAVLALGVVAAAACVVPALRATQIDPAVVLRGE